MQREKYFPNNTQSTLVGATSHFQSCGVWMLISMWSQGKHGRHVSRCVFRNITWIVKVPFDSTGYLVKSLLFCIQYFLCFVHAWNWCGGLNEELSMSTCWKSNSFWHAKRHYIIHPCEVKVSRGTQENIGGAMHLSLTTLNTCTNEVKMGIGWIMGVHSRFHCGPFWKGCPKKKSRKMGPPSRCV